MKIVFFILIVFLLYGLLFLTVDRLEKNGKTDTELTRKLLHIGSGLIALLFPLFFKTLTGVVYLGMFFTGLLLLLRNMEKFRGGIGRTLRKDERQSRGDIYFILSIMILWVFSYSNRILYYIPLLILIFPDAMAALGGVKFGKRKYKSVVGEKSIEGSAIFFTVTLAITFLSLIFFTSLGFTESMIISLLMAFLSMILEAVSWRGLDNIFVPVLSFFILKSSMESDILTTGINLLVTVVLFLMVILGKKYSSLSDDAALTGAFYCYFVWITGGIKWTIVTVFLYLLYRAVTMKPNFDKKNPYNFPTMLTICLPGLFWLIVYRITNIEDIFYIYLTVISSHLSVIGVARMRYSLPGVDFKRVVMINSLIGISYLTIFMNVFSDSFERIIWIFCILAVSLATLVFNFLQPEKQNYLLNKNRLLKHLLTVFLCSFIVVIPLWGKIFF
jgi:phytol kinase